MVFYEMKSRVVNFRNNLDENVGRMKFIVVGCELHVAHKQVNFFKSRSLNRETESTVVKSAHQRER